MLMHRDICQLCGVAFSVGRVRTISEPAASAWSSLYPYCPARDWSKWAAGCGRNSGCMAAFHYEHFLGQRATWRRSDIDDAREAILCYKDMPAEAKLMAGAALPNMAVDQIPPGHELSEYILVSPGLGQKEKLLHVGRHSVWEHENVEQLIQQRLENQGFILDHTGSDTVFPYGTFEHIAGPGCQLSREDTGYAGSRISFDEMAMSTVSQGLFRQDDPSSNDWDIDQMDNEDWEVLPHARYHLSLLCDRIPRNSVAHQFIHNRIQFMDAGQLVAPGWDCQPTRWYVDTMFHPSCLEVFKRAALKRHGCYDMEQLGRWLEATEDTAARPLPRHAAVQRSLQARWRHCINDEWVVANPCHITGLKTIIKDLGLHLLEADPATTTHFARLPVELFDQIFRALPIDAVANIAVAYPLLTSTVHRYLREHVESEWPYLWELWCRMPYSKWTTVRGCHMDRMFDRIKQKQQELDSSGNDLTPSIEKQIRARVYQELGFTYRPCLVFDPDEHSHRDFVHFISAVGEGMRAGSLKGLRNRRRIWADCELILDKIEVLERSTEGIGM